MSTKSLAVDGLWHCLCPSYGKARPRKLCPSAEIGKPRVPYCKSYETRYSTTASTVQIPIRKTFAALPREKANDPIAVENVQKLDLRDILSARNRARHRPGPQQERWREYLAKKQKAKELHHLSPDDYSKLLIEDLHGRLEDAARRGRLETVKVLIRHLVEVRGEAPVLLHYHALIRANTHAQTGSASAVKILLNEMKEKNIMADSTLYHHALKALAVHPDYLLQTQILEDMRMRWFNLTDDAYHDLVCGLTRSKHFELAIDKMEEMQDQKVPIKPWLYDLVIYALLTVNEVNEAARILRYREKYEQETQISPNVWFYLLETASRNLQYEAVLYVWRRRVETSLLNPPDGMCQNVLDTAARHGDTQLATHVLNILGARGLIFKLYHFEALLEAYVFVGDVPLALEVLNVMNKNKIIPETGSTRPIFFALRGNKDGIHEAWNRLESFSRTQQIPVAGANVIIEAATDLQDAELVETFYKALPQICSPDLRTFHILFLNAVQNSNLDFAEKLLSDMETASISPDTLILDRLLLVSARKGALSKAKQIWDNAVDTSHGPWRLGTYWSVIRLATTRRDTWAMEVLEATRLAFPDEPVLADVERWVRTVMQGVEGVEEPWIEVEF